MSDEKKVPLMGGIHAIGPQKPGRPKVTLAQPSEELTTLRAQLAQTQKSMAENQRLNDEALRIQMDAREVERAQLAQVTAQRLELVGWYDKATRQLAQVTEERDEANLCFKLSEDEADGLQERLAQVQREAGQLRGILKDGLDGGIMGMHGPHCKCLWHREAHAVMGSTSAGKGWASPADIADIQLDAYGEGAKHARERATEECQARVDAAVRAETQRCTRSVGSLLSVPCASPDFLEGVRRAVGKLEAGPLTTQVDTSKEGT